MRTFPPRLARSIAGLSALMIGAGVMLWAWAVVSSGRPIGLPSHQLTTPISGAVFAVLGGLLLSRRPHHPIGWMLAGLGVLTGMEVLNLGFLAYRSLGAAGQVIPAPGLSHSLANWIWSPRSMIPLTLFILLFPDGKLPSPRWRPIAWAAVLIIAVSTITNALTAPPWEGLGGIIQNPIHVQSQLLTTLGFLAGVPSLPIWLSCMASVFVRFRRSDAIERQQLKWMAYAVAAVGLLFVIGGALFVVLPDRGPVTELGFSIINVAGILLAVAAAVAVLRYRLYDIDLIINRTLVYALLTLLVVGMYVLLVGSLGALFQARENLLVSLVATGVIAVLFQPVRERLQGAVDRWLYGERDRPYEVLSRLGRQLEGNAEPSAMLATIAHTIAQALKLPYVAISLPDGEQRGIAGKRADSAPEPLTLPLKYQGEVVGRLTCAPRGPGEPFSDSERALLHDVSNQAAVAVHALRLSRALQQSRERLVNAREEERRRLRRDLHDGLGPQLASLVLKLDAARNQLKNDPKIADAILLQLRWQVQEAINDIRRLVYNLRPPTLDELGLLPALRASAVAQFSSGTPRVIVEGPRSMPDLPAAVEVAAYRIVQEAVTNVARHARAQHCYVRLELDHGLQVEVRDDGDGLPEGFRAGVGLSSMQERASELGGRFQIEALPEGGTRVVAQFPLSLERA